MSDVPLATQNAATAAPAWSFDKNRIDLKMPIGSSDFATLVAALSGLATADARLKFTAVLPAAKVVQRTWEGHCSPEEFALMLADTRRFVVQVAYGDASVLWLDLSGGERWRWCTPGAAHDAALEFSRRLRKGNRLRSHWFSGAWLAIAAAVAMVAGWSRSGPPTGGNNTPTRVYVGPDWYMNISLTLFLVGVIGLLVAPRIGMSKRRYLRKLSPGRPFPWRRFIAFHPVDVTNQLLLGLVIGVLSSVLVAVFLGR